MTCWDWAAPMTDPKLAIVLDATIIGTLTLRGSSPEISYSAAYRENPSSTTLSVAMPKARSTHHGKIPDAWLWGLLPDNEDVLHRWAKDYDASISSPVSFLATEIGMDCAGAVQFHRSDQGISVDRDSHVLWIQEHDVANRLADLRSDSTTWLGQRNAGQFSLAGAQSKTALRWEASTNQWGVPRGDEPSTHILKPAVPSFDDQHINEHLCMLTANNLGLVAAKTRIASFDEEEALVVERFDRAKNECGEWVRIHQEDLCQARGLHPGLKYQSEGGPSASEAADVIERATGPTVAKREIQRFVDALIFNWIIAGTDAHAKNYGLLHRRSQTRLAPLCDVSSSLPYDDSKGHKVKLAMKIGGEYKIKRIGRMQWKRLATELNLDVSSVLDRCEELATDAPSAFERSQTSFEATGHVSSMPEQLTTLVTEAARARLDSLTRGNLHTMPALARWAIVLTDPIPFVDLPHSDTLSVRMQMLVKPPDEPQFRYYQFLVARWPSFDLEANHNHGDPDFWSRVGSTAAEAARHWLRDGQPDLMKNPIDAVVLRMTKVAPELRPVLADTTFEPGHIMLEWTDDANLIQRDERDLKPMNL